MIDIVNRALDRMRPTRIIRDGVLRDLRLVVSLLLLLAAWIVAELAAAAQSAVMVLVAWALGVGGIMVWFLRPTVTRSYIPFEHYEWEEQIVVPLSDGQFDCLHCRRRLREPDHLEVTRCRCGTVYGTAGAALYVRWER